MSEKRFTLAEPLDDWHVTLASGDVVTLWAHVYSQQDDDYVFELMVHAVPVRLVELARSPKAAVTSVRSDEIPVASR
jgi:hypothetical protein